MIALPPEAGAFVRAQLPRLRRALDACPDRPVALVLVHEGRDRETLPAALADIEAGHAVRAYSLARVRALARLVAPAVADRLAEPLAEAETWCLIVGPEGAGVLPITWENSIARGM